VLQFVSDVKDTGKEEYLRPFIHIELDWKSNSSIYTGQECIGIQKTKKHELVTQLNMDQICRPIILQHRHYTYKIAQTQKNLPV